MAASARAKPADALKRNRVLVTVLVALSDVLGIACLLALDGNPLIRFAAAVVLLMASGTMIAAANGIGSSYGAFMLGSRRGIAFVEFLSKRRRFWNGLCNWGLVLGFGLLSFFMFRKYMSRKAFLFGVASLVAVLLFVFPYLSLIMSFINIPQVTSKVAMASASASTATAVSPVYYLLIALAVIGGFCLYTALLILYAGGSIVYGILTFVAGFLSSSAPDYGILNGQIPGVAPVIPGITIPLFAGIAALLLLLVVHEFAHGALARMAKVKIRSIGVILFGIIPLGAFVEPDESQIKKLRPAEQDRISIAGISANFLTAIFFFAITMLLATFVLPSVGTGGVVVTAVAQNAPASNVIAPNSILVMWNIQTIRNQYDLSRAEAAYVQGNYVRVSTDNGTYVLTPTAQGRLGIAVAPAASTLQSKIADFLYAVAALSFGLNFFVAIFNLLPIPGFDGWRIFQSKIKSKTVLKAIAALIVAAILANALPWFWTL
ncbi:Peptidase family M50 [uncultured archaeon]|nr:Peptidase family M50 [uncultured archaeon]